MNIDIQPLLDFEKEVSAVVDALGQLKRLEPPVESDGAMGLAKWHRDFDQILQMFTALPDPVRLARFAEELTVALAEAFKAGQGEGANMPSPQEERMLPTPRGFWAEIVSETGSGAYTFKEKRLTDGTTWADLTGGRTGTCYEINDLEDIAVGTIVRVSVEHDTSGTLRYVCEVVTSVELTPITSIRYDTATRKFQYKKTTIRVLQKDAEDAAWTDWLTLTDECDIG